MEDAIRAVCGFVPFEQLPEVVHSTSGSLKTSGPQVHQEKDGDTCPEEGRGAEQYLCSCEDSCGQEGQSPFPSVGDKTVSEKKKEEEGFKEQLFKHPAWGTRKRKAN